MVKAKEIKSIIKQEVKDVLKKAVKIVGIIILAPSNELIKLRQLINGKNKPVYKDYFMELEE